MSPFIGIRPEFGPRNIADMRKLCPQLWQAIYGRRYVLPQYRQADYASQDKLSDDIAVDLAMITAGIIEMDDVQHAVTANYFAALHYGRPMIWLEKELAGPLANSAIPADMSVDDIEWPWPQFRVMLPEGTLTILRDGKPRSLMYLDIVRFRAGQSWSPPLGMGQELERFLEKVWPSAYHDPGRPPMTDRQLYMVDPAMSVSGGLGWSEFGDDLGTHYSAVMHWENITLGEAVRRQNAMNSPRDCDDADNQLLFQMQILAINVLLFLSQKPMVYQPEVVRPARAEGKHKTRPALLRAHFLGQEQFKAAAARFAGKTQLEPTGKHLKAMWRKGHWKRQPYGPKHSLRRWQWISIYHTFGEGLDELGEQQ